MRYHGRNTPLSLPRKYTECWFKGKEMQSNCMVRVVDDDIGSP